MVTTLRLLPFPSKMSPRNPNPRSAAAVLASVANDRSATRKAWSRHPYRASPAPRTLPQNPTTRMPALMPPLPAEMTAGLPLIGYVPTALVFHFL